MEFGGISMIHFITKYEISLKLKKKKKKSLKNNGLCKLFQMNLWNVGGYKR